jgi:hypothetical protein
LGKKAEDRIESDILLFRKSRAKREAPSTTDNEPFDQN